jgi:hypothetical protein
MSSALNRAGAYNPPTSRLSSSRCVVNNEQRVRVNLGECDGGALSGIKVGHVLTVGLTRRADVDPFR